MSKSSKIVSRLLVAMMAVGTAGILVGTGDAQAQGRGRSNDYVEWNFKTARPVHGYSGFAGGGSRAFCDYRRIPERKCTYTASGESRCKVVGWTLQQYCY